MIDEPEPIPAKRSHKRRNWLIGIGVAVAVILVALVVAASILSKRFEPYIREQAILYLQERFDSDVTLTSLRVQMPKTSPIRLMVTKGHGVSARVVGEGLSMRHRRNPDSPPMFAIKKFSFSVDLGTLFETPKRVPLVTLEGMELNIPPKGERPDMGGSKPKEPTEPPPENSAKGSVIIDEILINDAKLLILPKDKNKKPLDFALHRIRLQSAGQGVAMKYDAQLTNPKPIGEIDSQGTFGPWAAHDPGDTPLTGKYKFGNADLSIFSGIAGILNSTGEFEGTLSSITARGEASVPDFRLKMSGNPVPLYTRFETLVDGTNGNTILKPVHAKLGSTQFTTSGGVIRHEGEKRKSIDLDVLMPNGNMRDLLRLATKGTPFMDGRINLKTKISIPPLTGKVREKLLLNGRFDLTEGKFLKSSIQDQIDGLSRKGQGQPKNTEIDHVVSRMQGAFTLANEVLTFRSLSFGVPGADVSLAGNYNMDADILDFHGALKLRARVSQTQSGWKRWALKPVDPFFAKQGAGTFLKIKVDGSSKAPKFGLDRKKKEEPDDSDFEK